VEKSQKVGSSKLSSERIVKDIRRATRKQCSAEEEICIVLDGLRGEHSIAELCSREASLMKKATQRCRSRAAAGAQGG
jgi:hypothetical protein